MLNDVVLSVVAPFRLLSTIVEYFKINVGSRTTLAIFTTTHNGATTLSRMTIDRTTLSREALITIHIRMV
jgi:hypothetical protein